MKEEISTTEQLNDINKKQFEQCNNTARYIVYGIFVSTWVCLYNPALGTKLGSGNKSLLIITLILSIIYLTFEIIHYFIGGSEARRLLKKLNKQSITEIDAKNKMNEISTYTYTMMVIKMVLLVVMFALLLIYYIGIL